MEEKTALFQKIFIGEIKSFESVEKINESLGLQVKHISSYQVWQQISKQKQSFVFTENIFILKPYTADKLKFQTDTLLRNWRLEK